MIEEASALFESSFQNQAFVDGNKRTAITSCAVFLMMNGFALEFDDLQTYEWLMNLYAESKVRRINIENWLREHAKPAASD